MKTPERRSRPRPRPRATRGFSLAELLIVTAVMGIMFAIVAPRIDVARIRVDTEIQNLSLTLNAAQRLAVLNQYDIVLAFDVAQHRVRIHHDENNNTVVDSGESIRWVEMEDGVGFGRAGAPAFLPGGATRVSFTKLQDGMPALTFRRNGSASEYGGFYITSGREEQTAERAEDVRGIEVERSTGQVTCMSYASLSWETGC